MSAVGDPLPSGGAGGLTNPALESLKKGRCSVPKIAIVIGFLMAAACITAATFWGLHAHQHIHLSSNALRACKAFAILEGSCFVVNLVAQSILSHYTRKYRKEYQKTLMREEKLPARADGWWPTGNGEASGSSEGGNDHDVGDSGAGVAPPSTSLPPSGHDGEDTSTGASGSSEGGNDHDVGDSGAGVAPPSTSLPPSDHDGEDTSTDANVESDAP